ncbi:ABZ2 [Candida margitis]|uniref:ABZ2 n=1 Tax=Candida margitis TaxID=1775924 RepID=UPI0022261036|nr:ABZ2 [Candida margitis]KAI5953958.1 ABZ2 [Candida margitis]
MKSFQLDKDLKSVHTDYIDRFFPKSNSSIKPEDFEILSTIRYDPTLSKVPPTGYIDISPSNIFLLSEHVARLQYTFTFFHHLYGTSFDSDIGEEYLLKQIVESFKESQKPVDKSYKIRGLFKLDGSSRLEIHDTTIREDLLLGLHPADGENSAEASTESGSRHDEWDVYINTKSSLISPFTSFKTTKRDVYTEARRILPGLKPGKEEVLLFNSQNQLMEGSITNVAIKRQSDGKWVTPLLSSGCLCGVTRHYLLRRNFIEEDVISMKDVSIGNEVLLFNGIMGVVRGRIVG